MLKLKAVVFRYTGVYLARKEELRYLKSQEYWSDFTKASCNPRLDFDPINIQRILIGRWQSEHGLTRPHVVGLRRFRIGLGQKTLNWTRLFIEQGKRDLGHWFSSEQ